MQETILAKQGSIDARILTVAGDASATNAWMQLKGLVSHIQRLTAQLLTEPPTNREKGGTQSMVAVYYLVASFVNFAYAYFEHLDQLISDDDQLKPPDPAYWRYRALKKLADIWDVIVPLLLAVNDDRVSDLEAIIRAADPAVSWAARKVEQTRRDSPEQIPLIEEAIVEDPRSYPGVITLPYQGRNFELVRFAFAPLVSIIGMPYNDIETPWTWSVIWHEMAGHLVNLLDDDDIDEIVDSVQAELDQLDDVPGNTWQKWLAAGGSPTDGQPSGESGEMPVDRRGWVAELLEDAYGALSLGPAFLRTLESVLRQRYEDVHKTKDERHPHPHLRLMMARALLLEMEFTAPEVGIPNEHVAAAESLRPVATVLRNELDSKGLITQTVREIHHLKNKAEAFKEILLGERSDVEDLPFAAFVAGIRLAFDEQPARATAITQAAVDALDQFTPPSDLQELIVPPDLDFSPLFASKPSVQALLDEPFAEIDHATPAHFVHVGNKTITFWAHQAHHTFVHSH